MANVFTATGQQSIQAVSLSIRPCRTLSIPFKYTPAYRSPTFQIAVCPPFQRTKVEPYAGYHTIALQQPVSIQSGNPSIVVKLENPTSNGLTDSNGPIYPIACEGNGPCNGIFSDAANRTWPKVFSAGPWNLADLADFQESTYVSQRYSQLNPLGMSA